MFLDLVNKLDFKNGLSIQVTDTRTSQKSNQTDSTEMSLSNSMELPSNFPLSLSLSPSPSRHHFLSEIQPHYRSLPTTPHLSPDLSYPPDLSFSPDLTYSPDSPPEEDQECSTPSDTPKSECFPISPIVAPLFTVGDYQILSRLGSGAFSEVYLATSNLDHTQVALKMISKSTSNEASFRHEVSILTRLHHPNIVKLVDQFTTNDHYVIVQEYVPGGELLKLVANQQKQFTEDDINHIFRQCVDAIRHLHELGIAHRDIKLENFLFHHPSPTSPPTIKLCDFGFAVVCQSLTLKDLTKVGSDEYLAPELLVASDRPHDPRSCDLWSLGVILYTLVVGTLPFSYDTPQSRRTMFHRIASGNLKFPTTPTPLLSPSLRTLIRGLLKPNPRQRTPVHDLLTPLTTTTTV